MNCGLLRLAQRSDRKSGNFRWRIPPGVVGGLTSLPTPKQVGFTPSPGRIHCVRRMMAAAWAPSVGRSPGQSYRVSVLKKAILARGSYFYLYPRLCLPTVVRGFKL